MKVSVIFDPAYVGGASDAVWIIDSPENRGWFERQAGIIDPNSAVFQPSDPIAIIWNIFEHHPNWTEIAVTGEQVEADIKSALAGDAIVTARTASGCLLKRRT